MLNAIWFLVPISLLSLKCLFQVFHLDRVVVYLTLQLFVCNCYSFASVFQNLAYPHFNSSVSVQPLSNILVAPIQVICISESYTHCCNKVIQYLLIKVTQFGNLGVVQLCICHITFYKFISPNRYILDSTFMVSFLFGSFVLFFPLVAFTCSSQYFYIFMTFVRGTFYVLKFTSLIGH